MIAERATPFMDRADFSAKRQITALVRRLALKVLEANPGTTPHRVWAWIEWLDGSRPYNDAEREQLANLFARERALRAALLEHVLLTHVRGVPGWRRIGCIKPVLASIPPTRIS